MNKNDKQIFDMLENELKSSVENVNMPLRLQKESIVNMLKNADTKETESVVKADNAAKSDGKSRNNNIMIRKLTAIAAMLVIVVAGTLVMRPSEGARFVKADSFGEKFETPIKNVESIEKYEQIVDEIRNENKPQEENATAVQPSQTANQQKNPEVTAAQNTTEKEAVTSAIGSHTGYISSIKLENAASDKPAAAETPATEEPVGIATYGDFKADIVKTDGKYLYIASTGTNLETGDTIEQIRIVRPAADGSMEDVSTIDLFEGAAGSGYDDCIEIYLRNNRLTAIINRHNYSFSPNGEVSDDASTLAVYYDITDPYAPVRIREHLQNGGYIYSNLYEGKLCLVTAKSISDSPRNAANSAVPSFSIDGVRVNLTKEDIFYAPNDPEESYLFVTVTDVDDFTKGIGRLALLGTGNEIYCTPSAIVSAREFVSIETDENSNRSTMTEVCRINISGSSLELTQSCVLKGSLIGGISIDEESGYLNAFASDNDSNRLYVFDGKTNFVGYLDFPDTNKVTRVTFKGSDCYVMAEDEEGEKTIIIDCSKPSSPEITETISHKAFTDELYEISATQLLGIKDSHIEIIREENGEDCIPVPMSITLFDISDPKKPEAASVYSFDESFMSVASTDSRSVMIDTEKMLLGIPVMSTDDKTGTNSSYYAVFDISGGELVPLGTYTHSTGGDAAVRCICIGDILYTVSGDKIVSFDIGKNAPADTKLAEFPLN